MASAQPLPPDKAALMGMIASDGYLFCGRGKGVDKKLRYFVRFADSEPSMRRRFAHLVFHVYGIRARATVEPYVVVAYGKEMAEDLFRLASFGTYKWLAPLRLFTLESARAWLRSYFDGDGDVKVGKRPRRPQIRAKSVNLKGLQSVETALMRFFGIRGTIYLHGQQKNPRWSQAYDLVIGRGEEIERFAKEIGFNHPKKRRRLNRVLTALRRGSK